MVNAHRFMLCSALNLGAIVLASATPAQRYSVDHSGRARAACVHCLGEMHMTKVVRFSGMFAAAVIAAMTLVSPASAQATRTWISGVGDDVNPCSRTAPCKTFPGAIVKTAAGGEVDTLDPGGFGGVTVTKAITLADEGVGEGGILVAGTNGVTVNCVSDPNCVVILRGLVIDGGPVGSNSLNGVRFVAGRTLIIDNCTIRNFTGGSPNGYGVNFNPSASQTESLVIRNSTFVTNGIGGTGGGIFVQPSGAPTVNVTINNSQTSANGFGIRTDSTNMSGGSISTTIADSEIQRKHERRCRRIIVGASAAFPMS